MSESTYHFEGAFVSAVAPASSAYEAINAFDNLLEQYELRLIEANYTADYRRIGKRYRRKKELRKLVQRVRRTGKPQLGTFHSWCNRSEEGSVG